MKLYALPTDLAVIDALWIGEKTPDTFSALIQWHLSLRSARKIHYSHNALKFQYTGMIWHATTSDDPRECGVIEQTEDVALKGCVVRARKELVLNVTNAEFAAWLELERGKPYSHKQNIGHVSTIWRWLYSNGELQRNCSEFLAAACYSRPDLKFPKNKDYVLPTDTFRVIKPDLCA